MPVPGLQASHPHYLIAPLRRDIYSLMEKNWNSQYPQNVKQDGNNQVHAPLFN